MLSFEEFLSFSPKKPTYALFGWPLGHSMSPELHAMLFAVDGYDAMYISVAVSPEHFKEAFALAKEKLLGINVTIPYKKTVISYLDELDSHAAALQSVNTVAFQHGKAFGYNTDILGFAESLHKDGIQLKSKRVLLLGYGGAASVMGYHCAYEGANLLITGRNEEKSEALAVQLRQILPHANISACARRRLPHDSQIVVNGTPLGMFPNEKECPLRFLPHKTEYVFDAIYNPPRTSTIRLARNHKTKTRDGLYMLVMQAAHAQTIWTGRVFPTIALDAILRKLYGKMAVKRLLDKYGKRNIVLCGFMGSGKTTAGRRLAKVCGLRFVDADAFLEDKLNMKISDIFAEYGEEYFRQEETKCLDELSKMEGVVLALGGGAVLRPQNVQIVKATGFLIHLDTPLYRILKNISYSNSRPLLEQGGDREAQTRKLYHARKAIYHNVSDISIRSPRLSDLIDRILKSI